MYQLSMNIVRTPINMFYAVCHCDKTDDNSTDLVFASKSTILNIFNYKLYSNYIHTKLFDSIDTAKEAGTDVIRKAMNVINARRKMISYSHTFTV